MFLGLPWEFYLIAWVGSVILVCLFFAGASAKERDADRLAVEWVVDDSPGGEVVPFPGSFQEPRVFVDGMDRGWSS